MCKKILACLLFSFLIFSQGSAFTFVPTYTNKNIDTFQVDNIDILLELATKVYLKTPEKSLQYAEAAMEISRKRHDAVSEAKCLIVIGDVYNKLDYDRLSLPYYYKANEILINNKKENDQADVDLKIGEVYYTLYKIDSAKKYYNEAFSFYKKNKDLQGVALTYLKLGNIYYYTTNYDNALDLYLKSLSLYDQMKSKKGIAFAYVHIGILYTTLKDYNKALTYLEKSLDLYTTFEDPENLSKLYFRLAQVHHELKNYELAINYYDLSATLFDSLHFMRKIAYVNLNKAKIYETLGKQDKAITLAKSALFLFTKYEFPSGVAEVSNELGKYYLKEEDFTISFSYLVNALKISKQIKSWELLNATYLNLSNYYLTKGDYKNAYENFKYYQFYNDSILNQEKAARIAELQTKYETNQKALELLQKNEQLNKSIELIRKQKLNLYLFGSGIFIILLLSIVLYRQYKLIAIRGKKIEMINEKLDQRVKERTSALRLTQFSIEQAADPIFWIDELGNFIFVNNSACKTLGYPKSELFSKRIYDIIPKLELEDWKDFWMINKQEKSLTIETLFKKSDMAEFPVEIILNYIYHDDSEYALAFIRDISDRKQKEENLRKAKEKAEEADKLKSAFLANMSHEIRTPMNAIIGFSDMLLHEDFDKKEKREFANIIKSSGDTLLKLIDDIIDISLIEAGQLKIHKGEFNLYKLLREINRFFQEEKNRIEKPHLEIRLVPNSVDEKILIPVDQVRFRQVITNLLNNALKFTEIGFIEIGYSIVKENYVKIYVQDSGIGIPEDKLDQIFVRFNKLNDEKRLYGGTGLGLTISKRLVEQMGGNLEVSSELGKGSCFYFTIPCKVVEQPIEVNDNISLINNNLNKWQNKILLIVEDVESNYQFLKNLLKKTGIQILWAKQADEAMEHCRNSRIDLVLMDIQLPGKTGYEITSDILKIYPSLPIIAQTAYAFSDEKDKIIQAGCVEYLTKPLNKDHLLTVIQKYI